MVVYSTPLATTVQLARGQECWGEGASRWKAQLPECAERQGGRVATNLFVRDMDLGVPNAHDTRRLEVVADGLPLFGGVQLAVDTTLVSAIQGDGQPQRGAADRDGVALKRARRKKETTYPELVQPGSRARLVLALEVGGRWSQEARTFVAVARRGPHQVGAACDAAAHGTGVASSLVLNPLLCSCTGFCSFPFGAPRRSWCGRSHAP